MKNLEIEEKNENEDIHRSVKKCRSRLCKGRNCRLVGLPASYSQNDRYNSERKLVVDSRIVTGGTIRIYFFSKQKAVEA